MDNFVCREYYCPACDMPSEEHREGSCRCCGTELVLLAEKQRDTEILGIRGYAKRQVECKQQTQPM
jgi:hypothetical protein